ncbi:hypothetical protein TWF281_010983 [Arthrobotrys megalospora]
MAKQFASFLKLLNAKYLHSINSEFLQVLKCIPPDHRIKVKALGPAQAKEFAKAPLFPNAESLALTHFNPAFEGNMFHVKLGFLQQYQQQIKSLHLDFLHLVRLGDYEPPKPLNLQVLEHVRLMFCRNGLEPGLFYITWDGIKKLELLHCGISIIETQMDRLRNLTQLTIFKRVAAHKLSSAKEGLEGLLLNLPNPLISLYLVVETPNSTDPSPYPGKEALQRHHETLKRLWLMFTSNLRFHERNTKHNRYRTPTERRKCSHYCSEGSVGTVALPICSDDGSLDLKTLSKFPKLEHLVIPVEAPKTWASWAPSFSNLRSFYLINSTELYCSDRLPTTNSFRQDWINWLLAPYHQRRDGFNHLKLQVIAFRRPILRTSREDKLPTPGSTGYTAHFRDPDHPEYFSQRANTSEVVHHHYPEVGEFFNGYFVDENPDYVWPQEDNDVAKGVFEDDDELANLPVREVPRPIGCLNRWICHCIHKRHTEALEALVPENGIFTSFAKRLFG